MEGNAKVYTVSYGQINMTCKLNSKSATTILPVSILFDSEISGESSEGCEWGVWGVWGVCEGLWGEETDSLRILRLILVQRFIPSMCLTTTSLEGDVSKQIAITGTATLCITPSTSPTFAGDTLKVDLCTKGNVIWNSSF